MATSPATRPWNEFQTVETVRVTIATCDDDHAGTQNQYWLSIGDLGREHPFTPAPRGQSVSIDLDVPKDTLLSALDRVTVGLVEDRRVEPGDGWCLDSITIVVNTYFQCTYRPHRWTEPDPGNPAPAYEQEIPTGAWSLAPETPPATNPRIEYPSLSMSQGITWCLLDTFRNWAVYGKHIPLAGEYFALFVKDLTNFEWEVIRSQCTENIDDLRPKYGEIEFVIDAYFVACVLYCYYGAYSASRHITDSSEMNAIRHAVWQIRLTQYFGQSFAQRLGEAHEAGDNSSQHDEYVDRLNNAAAQALAIEYPDADPYQLARDAWEQGKLTSYSDSWPHDEL